VWRRGVEGKRVGNVGGGFPSALVGLNLVTGFGSRKSCCDARPWRIFSGLKMDLKFDSKQVWKVNLNPARFLNGSFSDSSLI
jgi:hypothetical protein